MARRSWRPFNPTYTPGTYTRIGLSSLSDKELATEYSRVRREVTERVRSFTRSKDEEVRRHAAIMADQYGVGNMVKYGAEASNYPTLKQIKDMTGMDPKKGGGRALMEDLLIEGFRFVSAKTSSVSGFNAMRDKQISALQAAGYEFVNRSNLREFGEFMDWFRSRRDSRAFGSNTVASAFSAAVKSKISSKQLQAHFKFYMEQVRSGADTLQHYSRKSGRR